ncbi:hypothetical protein LQK80_34355 [Bacillus thuringiensis]|nr:hypothetical protein [Bacillus thuringiensis]
MIDIDKLLGSANEELRYKSCDGSLYREKEELSDMNTWSFLFIAIRNLVDDYAYKNDLMEKFYLISIHRRKRKTNS